MFVVKINDYWLADWEGDPGRTLVLNNAKTFKTNESGKRALKKATKQNKHRDLTRGQVVRVYLTENKPKKETQSCVCEKPLSYNCFEKYCRKCGGIFQTAKEPYETINDLNKGEL
jgi:exoribonuclease R